MLKIKSFHNDRQLHCNNVLSDIPKLEIDLIDSRNFRDMNKTSIWHLPFKNIATSVQNFD